MENVFYCCRNRIKDFRKFYNLTQEELGLSIGVSQNTISSWEKCIYMPTLSNICALLDVLNCKFEDLFYYEYVGRFNVINDDGD